MEDDDAGDVDMEEIDLDYEFDAPRFFDLSRPELPSEARQAALWFDTAQSYPPSPFLAKMDNASANTGIEEVKCTNPAGSSPHSRMPHDVVTCDKKSVFKRQFSKGSTLMKPTASQMAKQTHQLKVTNVLRKTLVVKSEKSIGDPNDNAPRETKRQRLEGGHIYKVPGVKQQFDLTHKVPEKNGPAETTSRAPRLKSTVAREPELETARRATTFRARRPRFQNCDDLQNESMPTKYTFKARPLNRKILDAPSLPLTQKTTPRPPSFQEFHLKTQERAIKHSLAAAAASSLIAENHLTVSSTRGGVTGREKSLNQPSVSHQLQHMEGGNMAPMFRARSLSKKIMLSKGDVGVSRITKREITKPKEFKLSTNKNCQPGPLTELFNKLSLATEACKSTTTEAKLQQSVQGSKENMINHIQ